MIKNRSAASATAKSAGMRNRLAPSSPCRTSATGEVTTAAIGGVTTGRIAAFAGCFRAAGTGFSTTFLVPGAFFAVVFRVVFAGVGAVEPLDVCCVVVVDLEGVRLGVGAIALEVELPEPD